MSPIPGENKHAPDNADSDADTNTVDNVSIPDFVLNVDSSDDDNNDDVPGGEANAYMYQPLSQDPDMEIEGYSAPERPDSPVPIDPVSSGDTANDEGGVTVSAAEGAVSDIDSDQMILQTLQQHETFPAAPAGQLPDQPRPEKHEVLWNQSPSVNLDLTEDAEAQVKWVMAGFQLPPSQHPSWAVTISEDAWKADLLAKIHEHDDKAWPVLEKKSDSTTTSATDHDEHR